MIAFGQAHSDQSFDLARIAASLGLFTGAAAPSQSLDKRLFAQGGTVRAVSRAPWRVPRSPGGWPVLLEGWLDNAAELAGALGLEGNDCAATIYGAAVERWGDAADARAIGCYATIICRPDGSVRLARSPWTSRPLFYHHGPRGILAASLPRPLFAAGLAKRLRPAEIDALLELALPDDRRSLYEDIEAVPHGAIVTLTPGGQQLNRWYDPLAIPRLKPASDAECLEAAQALLERAVGAALAGSDRPGIALSGGLDSALACSEVLRQLPAERRLPSFTFTPLAGFDGPVAAHKFADDRPWVEAFAAMHPRLAPQFVDNAATGFDDRAEAMFLACDAGYPARVSGSVYHGVYAAAAAAGCDRLLIADSGNLSLSTSAPWARREFVRTGQWRQLALLARADLADPRPPWSRLPRDVLMQGLPAAWADRLRRSLGRISAGQRYANPFVRTCPAERATRDPGAMVINTSEHASRRDYVLSNYRGAGAGCEIAHSFEQVFAVQARDALAYRPLIEFCLGLPTEQFVRDGETRLLARRLARGRLPEAQRTNRLYGGHNVDWHMRLTPRRADLRAQAEALAEVPELAGRIDVAALIAAIDAWPQTPPPDPLLIDRYQFMIPAVLYIGRFLAFATGRNLPGASPEAGNAAA